jgi:hypothetical protein
MKWDSAWYSKPLTELSMITMASWVLPERALPPIAGYGNLLTYLDCPWGLYGLIINPEPLYMPSRTFTEQAQQCEPKKAIVTTVNYQRTSVHSFNSQLSHIDCFFGGTWFWTQGLRLTRQLIYHLKHAPSHFCLCYFFNRVLRFCPGPASDHNPPI